MAQTFEEWFDGKVYLVGNPEFVIIKSLAKQAWLERDAEIAEAKRKMREAAIDTFAQAYRNEMSRSHDRDSATLEGMSAIRALPIDAPSYVCICPAAPQTGPVSHCQNCREHNASTPGRETPTPCPACGSTLRSLRFEIGNGAYATAVCADSWHEAPAKERAKLGAARARLI